MEGGNDPDNRRGMTWEHNHFTDTKFLLFRNLILLRHEEQLKQGDIEIGYDNNLLYIKRTYNRTFYTLYTNVSNEIGHYKGNAILSNNAFGSEIRKDGFAIVKGYL